MNSKQKQTSFENTLTNTHQTGSVDPTPTQAGFLDKAFDAATAAFDQNAQNQYSGQQLAQFNPDQLANFRNMINFANTSTTPQDSTAVGKALTGAGVGGTTSALNKLTGYMPTGGVDTNLAAAGKYADNPYMSGMVDAAMRDANRQVSEQMLPQVARTAALGGNALSSKRAISEGIIGRGLAEKAMDVSANLRGDAWKSGLALSENARQFDNTSTIEAARRAGDIAADASKTGIVAGDNALDQQKKLYEIAHSGASGLRDADQASIENAKAMIEYANQGDWDNAARLYAIVGDKMWGNRSQEDSTKTHTGTKYSETVTDPGALAKVGAGVGALGSLFGMGMGGGATLGGSLFTKLFG